jgi:hypothetical protein
VRSSRIAARCSDVATSRESERAMAKQILR